MLNEPLILEQIVDAPVSKVWQAITDKDQMKQWYITVADFKPEPGFKFTFEGKKDDMVYVHLCEITAVEPGKKLQHTWVYQGYQGASVLTWELFEEGNKTRIKITHAGLETFMVNNNDDFSVQNFADGWQAIINTSLKPFVEN